MLYFHGALGLVPFAFWVFCLIDLITTDGSLCRNLQKTWWILIVLLLSGVGAVLWLIAGRPRLSAPGNQPYRAKRGDVSPGHARRGRAAATSHEGDEDFRRRCRERAEEQRRRYLEQQRRESAQEE